jgi:hypothetical protein
MSARGQAGPDPATSGLGRKGALLLGGLALAARIPWVLAYPAVHGGDSVARLARSDSLLLAYQLPLPQLLVFLARAVHPDPLLARMVFVVIGAILAPVAARAVAAACGRAAGLAAGFLAALHPLFVYYSLVPYQESSMLLLLLAAVVARLGGRTAAASLLLGLACLTRYEAWLAVPLFVWHDRRRLAPAVLLYGWAPLSWLLVWGGLSPAGTYVVDLDPSGRRLSRLLFLWRKLREYSGDLLLALAGLGSARLAWRSARLRRAPARPQAALWSAAYLGLFLLAVTLFGHEFPPGSGHVSERLVHVPALLVCALAGLGVAALAGPGRAALGMDRGGGSESADGPRAGVAGRRMAAVAVASALLAWQAHAWIGRTASLLGAANADPSLALAVQVARLAHERLAPGERIAVVAPTVSGAALDDYVRRVERGGGDAGAARAIAASLAQHSPDADRIAANLPRPPGTVVQSSIRRFPDARLIAVFDDAGEAQEFRPGVLLARFVAGARAVAVYRPRR